jgi:hypothetical protein
MADLSIEQGSLIASMNAFPWLAISPEIGALTAKATNHATRINALEFE